MRLALVAGTMFAEVEMMEQAGIEYPDDKVTWRVIIPNRTRLVIWPDEASARQIPPDADSDLRERAAEHVVMVTELRRKLLDPRALFSLHELGYVSGEYTIEDTETGPTALGARHAHRLHAAVESAPRSLARSLGCRHLERCGYSPSPPSAAA